MLFINYKVFISSQIQPYLIADLNEGMYRYSLSDAKKVDVNFPSLSGPTQPVKMLVGRYYRNVDSINTAKRLFIDAIKDNPYIKSPQAQLGYLYFDIEEFDASKLTLSVENNEFFPNRYIIDLQYDDMDGDWEDVDDFEGEYYDTEYFESK